MIGKEIPSAHAMLSHCNHERDCNAPWGQHGGMKSAETCDDIAVRLVPCVSRWYGTCTRPWSPRDETNKSPAHLKNCIGDFRICVGFFGLRKAKIPMRQDFFRKTIVTDQHGMSALLIVKQEVRRGGNEDVAILKDE